MPPLIEVRNLKKYFPVKKGVFSRVVGQVRAVDDISFAVASAETLGLVGESGCGKTTAGRSLLRLIEPTSGEILYNGTNLLGLPASEMRRHRRHMQIIFQDPYSSLNPRMTVGAIVSEGLVVHGVGTGKERVDLVKDILQRVGLSPQYINRYPHEFSGGQRQRIGIARALALNPMKKRMRIILPGDVPSPLNPPKGCRFHPRCPVAIAGLCDTTPPRLLNFDGHQVACHAVEQAAAKRKA